MTSVTLLANVSFLGSSCLPCQDAYDNNGKKAETYVKNASWGWTYQP